MYGTDVKPENFLYFNENGSYKIALSDFGGAVRDKDVWAQCFPMGSRGYMAPEHFRLLNFKKDKKTDVYSLGVSFQKMFPVEKRPLFLQVLCEKMLEKDPQKRPTIEEVQKLFNQGVHELMDMDLNGQRKVR